jgi:sulfur carrier protein ThiS
LGTSCSSDAKNTARLLRAGPYELPEGARVKTLLKEAGPPPRGVPLVILILGDRVEDDRRLVEGDEVTVLQFAAGG